MLCASQFRGDLPRRLRAVGWVLGHQAVNQLNQPPRWHFGPKLLQRRRFAELMAVQLLLGRLDRVGGLIRRQ